MYKVLIIDDNHSFIDSLKVILKDFPFQYDSAYRFYDADKKLAENGSYLQRKPVERLFLYESNLKKWEDDRDSQKKKNPDENDFLGPPDAPELESSYVNEDGYFLVIVEYDSETSMKGYQFIKNAIRNHPEWHENNFIILTNRLSYVENDVRDTNLAVIEKPIKQNTLKQVVAQRLKDLEEILEKTRTISSSLADPEPEEEPEVEQNKSKNIITKLKEKTSKIKTKRASRVKKPNIKKKTAKKPVKKTTKKTVKKKTTKTPKPKKVVKKKAKSVKPASKTKKSIKSSKSATKKTGKKSKNSKKNISKKK